jgi:hypothetical protein
MYQILKIIGFKYRKTNDVSTFFMERGGIVAVRIEFLRAVYKLRISGNKRPELCLDDTSVNHNH